MNSIKVVVAFWHLSRGQKLTLGGSLVLVAGLLWFSVGRPLHEHNTQVLHVMRAQLALLPPPSGATITATTDRGAFIGSPTLLFDYAVTGTCNDVQAHYAHAAPQAGWSVTKTVYLLRDVTGDTRYDFLESEYRKVVGGSTLALDVSCKANAPMGSGYNLYFTQM